MIECLGNKPGTRDGSSVSGCPKQVQTVSWEGVRQQETSRSVTVENEGNLCNRGSKRVETP